MKKVLVVFLMFFAFSSFADNSVEKEKSKIKQSELKITNYQSANKQNKVDFGDVACYVTIRNSETGETRKVYGIGSDLESCGRNAYALAVKVIENLNGR